MSDIDDSFIVKIRGLPWSAGCEDVLNFFKNCNIMNGKFGVHLTSSREGRPSGEAFIEFETEEDVKIALECDKQLMGSRYIEVFKVNRAEMDWVLKRSGPNYGNDEDGCVRLRGLPFGCSKEEIAQFFTGLEIVPNGITLLTDYSGRSSGEAYVQFVNKEVADKALQKHREKIGHRYIEIFRSSLCEVYNSSEASGGYNDGVMSQGRRGSNSNFNTRPGPYDRGEKFSNNRFQGRNPRSFKGASYSTRNSDSMGYDRGSNVWANNNGNEFKERRNSWEKPWNDNRRSLFEKPGINTGVFADDGLGNYVHMRGLPFRATIDDVHDFFDPIIPSSVRLLQDHLGRPSGEADVYFDTHEDAIRAMNKDKGFMQHRYIELFLNASTPGGTFGKFNNNFRR